MTYPPPVSIHKSHEACLLCDHHNQCQYYTGETFKVIPVFSVLLSFFLMFLVVSSNKEKHDLKAHHSVPDNKKFQYKNKWEK